MTMRERMARAVSDEWLFPGAFEKAEDEYRAACFGLVDAQLDCLTARPTEHMISAGLQECTHAAFAMDAEDVQRIYEAMTAAMIREGKE